MAAREGVSPVVYYHTRTPGEFGVAVRAWIESFVTPAAMLLGAPEKDAKAGSPSGRSTPQKPRGHAPSSRRERYEPLLDIARKYRSGRGTVRETIHDLDEMLPLDKEWTPEARQRVKMAAAQTLGAKGRT